jgi:hypothetical protein
MFLKEKNALLYIKTNIKKTVLNGANTRSKQTDEVDKPETGLF